MPDRQDQSDLSSVGHAASILSPRALHDSLDQAAEILREAIGADGLEVFFPSRGELCQVVARGEAARPCQEPVPPGNPPAPDEDEFLSVPLTAGGLLVARWRDSHMEAARAERMLRWASSPLEMAQLAEQTWLREIVGGWSASSRAEFLEDALHTMIAVGRARAGTLVLFDRQGTANVTTRVSSLPEGPDCPLFHRRRCPVCPLLEGARGFAVASSTEPAGGYRCQGLKPGVDFLYGISLLEGSRVRGAVLLIYAEPPRPPSRYLSSLAAVAECITNRLETSWPEPAPGASQGAREGLTIRCLGRFELWESGRSLPCERFRRTQALTVLKILLLRGGQPVARDALCEMLWPDSDPALATRRLHVVVHDLRQGLESAQRTGTLIKSSHGHYRLNLSDHDRVDLFRFRELGVQGRDAEARGRVQEAIACFEEAVALHRGELFADEPQADWCLAEREQLRESCLAMLKSLARLRAESGELARGVDHLQRALELDPLREDLHQDLMGVYLLLGRRQDALRQFEECSRLIRRELGCEPLPETLRLHARILEF